MTIAYLKKSVWTVDDLEIRTDYDLPSGRYFIDDNGQRFDVEDLEISFTPFGPDETPETRIQISPSSVKPSVLGWDNFVKEKITREGTKRYTGSLYRKGCQFAHRMESDGRNILNNTINFT